MCVNEKYTSTNDLPNKRNKSTTSNIDMRSQISKIDTRENKSLGNNKE